MKPNIPLSPSAPDSPTPAWHGPARLAALSAVGGLLAAGLGYGLQHSLPVAPWSGAAIAAAVAVLLVPALLWQRPPAAPKLKLKPVAAPAAAEAQTPARDALTGAYTQQHFVAAADREWSRNRRHDEDAALLMIDIDGFKALNEKHSNACGDALLVETTRQVSATLRQYDLLSRFSGGVLVVYLPHTDPLGALDVAERIRERVASVRLSWQGEAVRATVSVGVASIGPAHAALDAVIADAGSALREAKQAGRNCVRAAPVQPKRLAAAGPGTGARRPAGPV